MMAPPRRLTAGLAVAAALTLSACGSDNNSSPNTGGGTSSLPAGVGTGDVVQGKSGGTLTVLSTGDVDYLDPGAAYYQFTFMLTYATQRPLYSYKPDEPSKATPDFAASDPKITDGGRTITIALRKGVRFSPPVNREATSKDVKYAIERGFNPHVANGYAGAWFGSIEGAKSAKGGPIAGIRTPNDHTIVFKLTKPDSALVVGGLSLPLSAPVPEEYAKKFDDQTTPNVYGQHQVATGPYMVKNDAKGNTVGYKPGRSIEVVRNPNWDKSTDYRPAYLDGITFEEGFGDPVSAARKIIQGSHSVNGQGDFNVPPPTLKQIITGPQSGRSQLVVGPQTGRVRYVAMNTTIKPFDDLNVRKAVSAAMDRSAMRLAFGGAVAGEIPTHYLSAVIPGYQQAGGAKGPGLDFLANPSGDMKLAQSYMKKAGYKSGKYTGGKTFEMVSDNAGPTRDAAQIAEDALTRLGFKIHLVPVVHSTMYTKFCNIPKQKVPLCPSVGWQKDFPDPASVLEPTFKGSNIVQVNNSNWPQLNDPAIDRAMEKADPLVSPQARAKAFGAIDKQITAQAPGVPWLWDNTMGIMSKDVNGVLNKFNASWDLSFTSLK
jgi:peptide/nickel transport system substrate-binding protein